MELPQGLPAPWVWAAAALLAAVLAWAGLAAPWQRLKANEQSHVFLAAIVGLAVLWSISGRVGPALHLHLLGATLAYLMFGVPLATIALAIAAAGATLAGDGAWDALAGRALVAGALPVATSHGVLRLAEAVLPANFFSYAFIGAFLNGAIAMAASSAAAGAIAAAAAPGARMAGEDWLAMTLLLAFGEATLTGMLASVFAVYKPAWLATFSDERYLKRRGGA
jgi:uncharacterized membrane protein